LRLTPPLNLPAPGRRQCVYGALRGLARTCVFAKQSLGPIHCDPPERGARSAVPERASLLPKLRGQYAEFLDPVSLVHLRLLASPTCVGLRYGRSHPSAAGFSRVSTPGRSLGGRPPPSHSTLGSPLQSWTAVHLAAGPSFHGPLRVHRTTSGAGIFAGSPSATPLGPRLRTRLTLR
jgi:hypothetical protein